MRKIPIIAYIYMSICVVGILFLSQFGWHPFWHSLAVPTMNPPFADARSLQSAPELFLRGINPQDPDIAAKNISVDGQVVAGTMDYPSVWIYISRLFSLSHNKNFIIFCILEVASFVVVGSILLIRYTSWLLLLALFSSASLLAIERGNIDLTVYSLVALAIFLDDRISPYPFLVAVLAKVFPIFILPGLWVRQRTLAQKIPLVLGTVLACIFLMPQLPILIAGNKAGAGSCVQWTYGIQTLLLELERHHIFFGNIQLVFLHLAIGSIIFIISTYIPKIIISSREPGHLFNAGASIYVFTFIFAANWDYRLIFLIFCFPLLNSQESKFYRHIVPLLVLMAMSDTLSFLPNKAIFFFEAIKSVLFLLLAAVLWNRLPRYFQKNFQTKDMTTEYAEMPSN